MTRVKLTGSALVAALILLAFPAYSAAAEYAEGPTLKATGTTLEWTAVPEATTYAVYYATSKEFPYTYKKMEVSGLSATPPVQMGEVVRYYVKSVSPKSSFSNRVFIAYNYFGAETYPETSKSHATDPQGFQITGSVSVCKKATFEGVATGASQTLEVHPKYEQCEVELAGTFKAKVNTEGCNYLFHVAPRDSLFNEATGAPPTSQGSTDVVCQAGKEIKVEVEGIEGGCQIKVPAQTGLKNVEYVNEGTGAGRKVSVNANVTGIKWSATGACGLKESSGTNGEYREGKISGLGIPELGSGPATALTEGFNETEGAEAAFVQ